MIDVGLSPTRFHAGDPVDLEISLTNTGTGTCTNVIFTLRLPTGIARLHGRERIEVSRVLPGESKTSRLGIRAEEPGRYWLTSTNFSYRDHRGRPHRESGFGTEITVDPAPDPPPPPHIMVELQDTELPCDEWTIIRGRITNAGAVSVSDLEIRLSGQVTTDQRTARSTLQQLPPGRSVDVPFYVLARHAGANVPVHLDLVYHHQYRRQVEQMTQSIRVVRDRTIRSSAASAAGEHLVKVLILGANPPDTESLWIGGEIREIQNVIRAGRDRDNIEVRICLAVRPDDISQALLDEEPWLVHFAGHGGGPDQSFAAESEYGLAHVIPVDGLVGLFAAFGGNNVECVLVNACDTELLARELSEVIPYAIGMRQPVHDKSAIRFSRGFYRALAAGKSIDDAFRLGVIELKMAPSGSDASAPVLFRRDTGHLR
jgi:uncharacterized repeat protein (TIGR01451 family)